MARSVGRFGPFELLRSIGEGANGEVWEARRVGAERRVAVKLLTGTSTEARARFFRECRVVLEHPHIVRVQDHGEAEGTPWLELELLRGQTLQHRLSERGLRLHEAVEVARQAAAALEHAHAQGIVHRDLKPENMMLLDGPALHVKVLDFGLARLRGDDGVTRTGAAVGTALYMAPEQVHGIHGVDARADVWSLGVVLHQCLLGYCPFRADNVLGTLYQILHKELPPLPRSLLPELRALLERMLDRDPARRPGAAEVSRALDAAPLPTLTQLPRDALETLTPTLEATEDGLLPANFDHELLSDQRTQSVLIAVVFLRRTRDLRPVTALAEKLGGRVTPLLRENVLVLFGHRAWRGDEPERAVRLAAAAAGCAEAVGVATGRVLRFEERLVGVVTWLAASLAREPGVNADATTAELLKGRFRWTLREDGSARLEASSPGWNAPSPGGSSPFVGRESERRQLLDLVREAREACAPTGMVLTGAVGMGKSRLRWAAREALRGECPEAVVLLVRCDPLTAHSPFAALREGLTEWIDALLLEQLEPTPTGDPQAALDRIRGALEAMLRELASRGPLVLAVDDAQWLDAASVQSLRWIAQNCTDLAVTLWFFATPDATDALTTILPSPNVRQLDVLPEAHARRVLQHRVPSAPAGLLERAGGHPLFLEELGRLYAETGAMPEQLPPSLAVAFLAVLDRLPPTEREFLKRAALFGRTSWLEAVVHLGGEASALDRLVEARILVRRTPSRFPGRQQLAFRSGAPQEAALELWPEGQRRGLQARAAEWLAREPGVSQGELGEFWERAGDLHRAAQHLVAAARVSARIADTASTLALTDRALACMDRAPDAAQAPTLLWDLLIARDDVLQYSSPQGRHAEGLARLGALCPKMGADKALELAWREGFYCRMHHDLVGAEAHGLEAVALAEALGDLRGVAMAHAELVYCYTELGRFALADGHAAEAVRSAEAQGDPWLQARCLNAMGYGVIEQDRLAEALDCFARAADCGERAGDSLRVAVSLNNCGAALLRLGRLLDAQERISLAVERARRTGNHRTFTVARHNRAVLLRMLGDLEGSARLTDEVEPAAVALGHRLLEAEVVLERVFHALALTDRGARRAALAALQPRVEAKREVVRIPSLAAGMTLAWTALRAALGEPLEPCARAAQGALAAGPGSLEARALLAVSRALADAAPARAAEARQAIQAFVDRAAFPGEALACRSAFVLRWAVPPTLLPA
ncbi:MAG: protein kinase [Deltaproteobacteria bacterium]|nr:protein kinase [Deltaproteobacteria bacterium]